MEEEEGSHGANRSGSSLLISRATMTRAPPLPCLSPSINICKAYHEGRSHDTEMVDLEEDGDDEEDVDYEEEEEEEEDDDDDDDGEEEAAGCFADEDEDVDMGTFSEPGTRFLSKVWKEYDPICADGIVIAAVFKHCERKICAERKRGTSSLRKHLKRCKERRKALSVFGQLSA